jgi:hypothetical protein
MTPAHAEPNRFRCSRCKQVKGRTKFSSDASRATGRFPWCMDCQNQHMRAHRFQNEDDEPNGHICPVDDRVVRGHSNRRFCSSRCKEKVQSLKRNFGLTIEQFRQMVEAANGRCPICEKRPTEWHVDHDHGSGKVMGVVCAACNVGALASTYHDPAFVRRLLTFLEAGPALALGIDVTVPEGATKPSNIHRVWARSGRRTA